MKKLLPLSALIFSLSFACATFTSPFGYLSYCNKLEYKYKTYQKNQAEQAQEREERADQLFLKNLLLKESKEQVGKNSTLTLAKKKNKNAYRKSSNAMNAFSATYMFAGVSAIIAGATCCYYNKSLPFKGLFSAAAITLGGASYGHLTSLAETNKTKQVKFNEAKQAKEINAIKALQDRYKTELKSCEGTEFSALQTTYKDNTDQCTKTLEFINKEAEERKKNPVARQKEANVAASILGIASFIPLANRFLPSFMPYLLNCSKYLPFVAKS